MDHQINTDLHLNNNDHSPAVEALHSPTSFEEVAFFHDLLSELEDSFGVGDTTSSDDAFAFMLNDECPPVTPAGVQEEVKVDQEQKKKYNKPSLTVSTTGNIGGTKKKGSAVVSPMHMDLIIAACNDILDDDDTISTSCPETPTSMSDSENSADSSFISSCSRSSVSSESSTCTEDLSTGKSTQATPVMDKVDHTYIDYSSDTSGATVKSQVGRKARKPGVFPEKLMTILSKPEHSHIISWLPHGRAFIVRDSKLFGKVVLPTYFKTTQVKSFRKQLSLWGFKRLTRGPDGGAYYHQLFLRGMPSLLKGMRYQKIKGTGKALTPNPEEEPDFYELARRKPLPPAQLEVQVPPAPVSPPGYPPSPQQMHHVGPPNTYPNYYANVWGNVAPIPPQAPVSPDYNMSSYCPPFTYSSSPPAASCQ